MKILLVGEFSRLHNSLKEGLEKLGHQVTLIGDGDHFKDFPVDISLKPKVSSHNWLFQKIRVGIYKLSGVDLAQWETSWRFSKLRKKLQGFDVVQFIHSNALKTPLKQQLKQVEFLKKHNKKLFLVTCGNDYRIVKYNLSKKAKYSPLTPYLEGKDSKENAEHMLMYGTSTCNKYYLAFEGMMDKIIPADMDYAVPLKDFPKATLLIPTPINIDKLNHPTLDFDGKINIFLGINDATKIRKGIPFFEKVLPIIQQKYPEKVSISIVSNLPYQEYIKRYDSAHIFLDMVYAYDQGYNALEAMAKGKVVFTGAEKEFLENYNLAENEACINALPDTDYLVEKLSWLIENPDKIKEIGKNARKFVKREHDYVKIAQKYLNTWNQY